MLKSLVSVLVAVSFPILATAQVNEPAEAATPAPETSESSSGVREPIFVDRGYLLPRGQFGVELGLAIASSTTKTENNLLVEREYRAIGSELKANLTYGILNDLNVFLGTTFVPNYESENQTTLDKTKSKGMSDPTIGIAYRVLNQSATMPFDVLLGLAYSPKGAVSKTATTSDDGNASRGSDAKSIILGFYRRTNSKEFGLKITHEMAGEKESENATSGDTSKTDAHASTTISGTAQFAASKRFYIMAGLGLNRISESTETEDVSGDTIITEAYVMPVFSGGLRIIAIQQKMFVDLGLSVTAGQDIEVSSNTGTTGKIKSVTATMLTAGVQFEF
jgi:hypothetical protein